MLKMMLAPYLQNVPPDQAYSESQEERYREAQVIRDLTRREHTVRA